MGFGIKNVSGNDIFMEFYGGLIENNEFIDFEDSDLEHDDLTQATELHSLITQLKVETYLNGAKMSVSDAMRHLTPHSAFKDAENERYLISEGKNVTVDRHTQVRIMGRPIIVEANADLTLEEGADIIVE